MREREREGKRQNKDEKGKEVQDEIRGKNDEKARERGGKNDEKDIDTQGG